jgi:hypothetical protein
MVNPNLRVVPGVDVDKPQDPRHPILLGQDGLILEITSTKMGCQDSLLPEELVAVWMQLSTY